MEWYDYREEVSNDIEEYIKEHYTNDELRELLEDRDDFEQDIYDTLFVEDCVTGNASGSYWCNAYKAEEALSHNWDLVGEALEEFGCGPEYLKKGPEACDVTVRCYLLGECLSRVLDKIEEDLEELEDERED